MLELNDVDYRVSQNSCQVRKGKALRGNKKITKLYLIRKRNLKPRD